MKRIRLALLFPLCAILATAALWHRARSEFSSSSLDVPMPLQVAGMLNGPVAVLASPCYPFSHGDVTACCLAVLLLAVAFQWLHRSSNRLASRSIAPARFSRLYRGGTWSSVRARAVDRRLYHQRWSHIQSSCACLVFDDGLALHRLLSKRTSGGIVPERAMSGWI
jgi:hypothetical protein